MSEPTVIYNLLEELSLNSDSSNCNSAYRAFKILKNTYIAQLEENFDDFVRIQKKIALNNAIAYSNYVLENLNEI